MNVQLKDSPHRHAFPLLDDPRFEAYTKPKKHLTLIQDALAGLIVAMVSIPLGIGFSMASGLKPEQGIVAGAIAGILGGLFGGSKYQVYGPTAAFIPLLSSLVAQYDVPFLLLASVIAGVVVMLMGVFKLGDHFAKVPFSVTVGFTIGIALSIILGQLPDALGSLQPLSAHSLEKIQTVAALIPSPNGYALLLALLTIIIIKGCYKVSVFIPGPLIAILAAILLVQWGFGGESIPLVTDKFAAVSTDLFKLTFPSLGTHPGWAIITPVLSIVFIASLESLLSARMADRLAGSQTSYHPNQELIGQGLVNMIVPLLNGFPCTGAFARTATSIKAGAMSPAASIFNGSFVILLMICFAHYIGMIPMACISGLLLYVAFNMVKINEVRYVFTHGKLHTLLMFYTATVTVLTDLFIAVSSATALYYLVTHFRKQQIVLLTLCIAVGSLCLQPSWANLQSDPTPASVNPLELLITGNRRFSQDEPLHPHQTHNQLLALCKEQHPFVAVLGCSDSRVLPENIFDQGVGDIV